MLLFIPPAFAAAALANSYRMVWADGFNTEATPDPANWTYEHGFVRNKELQWYRPDNAGCSNGLLAIEGRREWKPNPNHKPGSNDPKKCSCQVWHYASLRCCRKTPASLACAVDTRFEARRRRRLLPGAQTAVDAVKPATRRGKMKKTKTTQWVRPFPEGPEQHVVP